MKYLPLQLAIMKSPTDRSLTLLHMIVESIDRSFPELSKFAEQLKFVDKASGGMLLFFVVGLC